VQLADELAQCGGVAGIDRLDDLGDIVLAQVAFRVARRNGRQCRGHVFVVGHAGLQVDVDVRAVVLVRR
jgi:hypothetical protein